MRSDGSGADLLIVPAGGSALPASLDTVQDGLHYLNMNGREVFRFATRVMAQSTIEAVKKANLTLDDVDWVIPHQANRRIIETAMRKIDLPMERCVVNIEYYGITSTASIPIATCEAVEDGRVKPGDIIVFVGFGAGLTWGASVVKWSSPFPSRIKMVPGVIRFYARIRSAILRLLRRIETIIWGRDH